MAAGWCARASSWTAYEVECEWALLGLVEPSADERLPSGVVEPARVEALAAVLAGLGVRYSLELWDGDRAALVRELSG